jgi:hypothetical protein
MTIFLRIIYLAFNLYFSRTGTHAPAILEEISREYRKEKRKRQQIKFKQRERFRKSRIDPRFKNTKAKDHRFSNQKSLRRMYRNS